MNLLIKNILHFWKTHLIVLFSFALACAVILASLIVGDSLEQTLRDKAVNRLGKIESYVEKMGGIASVELAGENTTAVLALDAIAISNSVSRAVKLYVVDDDFWELSLNAKNQELADGVLLNETLAKALGLSENSQLALRFAMKDFASTQVALNDDSPKVVSASFNVEKILAPEDFADFFLYDWQNSPPNVFIKRDVFCDKFTVEKSANLYLSKGDLSLNASFENLGLFSTKIESDYLVKSKHIFIAEEISKHIKNAEKTLSWFISKIEIGEESDFNAFIVGAGKDLGESQVEINEVYAKERNLNIGDSLKLSYYTFDEKLNLHTSNISLEVAKISPVNTGFFKAEIVPEYAGLTDVEDCTQWKSSIPIDLKKITQADKTYWSEYGATPKLRVSYSLGKKLFGGAMGEATALILDYEPSQIDFSKIDLEKLGFIRNYPKKDYLNNAENGVDFKGLFIGLSFFIIINAMLLVGLVLKMNLTARYEEIRLWKYLGFKRRYIENFYLKEYFLSIVLGGVLGLVLGLAFAKILVFMLNSLWGDISDSAEIFFSYKISSIIWGFCLSVLFGFVILKLLVRKFFIASKLKKPRDSKPSILRVFVLGGLFIFTLLCGLILEVGIAYKAVFSLVIYVVGIYFSLALFRAMASVGKSFKLSDFIRIGIYDRVSKSVYLLLSLGVYLLCVVGLNKIDSTKNASEYEYVVKTFVGAKVPVQDDFDMLALRLKEGAKANCLNLNKVSSPQVLGANIEALIDNKAISIKSKFEGELEGNFIKAYIDESSMIWSLKASLGDEFEYESKLGKFNLKIVGALNPSVFQGSFIIDDADFRKLWGADSAYNIFLARPKNGAGAVELSKVFSEYLADVDTAKSILDKFDSLQNAYLKIFYQLGILGLILGVFGTLIAIRNRLLNERKHLEMLGILGLRASLVSYAISMQYLLINLGATALGVVASLPLIRIEENYLKAFLVFFIIMAFNLAIYPMLRSFLMKK